MTWGEFKDAVTSRLHDPALATLVWEWFNDTQFKAALETRWRHFTKTFTVATVAPVAATATVTQGSDVVTVAGAVPAASWVGQLFKLDAASAYYEVLALVAGQPQQIQLASAYSGSSGVAQACKVVFWKLALPVNWAQPTVARVAIVSGTSNPQPLQPMDVIYPLDEASPTGTPSYFRIDGGAMQLWRPPSSVFQFKIQLERQPTPMTKDSVRDTPLDWPLDFHNVLLDGTLKIGAIYIDDSQQGIWAESFAQGLAASVARQNTPAGIIQRMGRWDGGSRWWEDSPELPDSI